VGRELRGERGQETAAVALEAPEQPLHTEHAHLRSQVLGRDVLEMMRLVDHEPAIGRQDGRLLPVVGRDPHREVRGEQVVVNDHHVGLGGLTPRLEEEAVVKVGALEPRTQIRLRGHRVPHVGRRLLGEIGEAPVAGARGPSRQRFELGAATFGEQRLLPRARLVEPRQAEIVPPPLEQRERHGPVTRRERAREDGEILPDELLLEVDGVGRDDGALAVGPGPLECGDKVGERLANPRPRLE